MIPQVTIGLVNGQIGGAVSTGDNVNGAVVTGNGTGALALLTPIKVTSLADAITKGVTLTDEPIAYKAVSDFYEIPGTINTPYYLMLAVNTATLVSLADKTNTASGAIKLINYAAGGIRVLSLSRTPDNSYVPTAGKYIDTDAENAAVNAQALAQDAFDRDIPCRILIGARVVGTPSDDVFMPNTLNCNKVGFVIGNTVADGGVAMGLVQGRVGATAPHVNIGRNKDGALPVNMIYLGADQIAESDSLTGTVIDQGFLNSLIDGGYITFTTYPQTAGIYISDDPMACAQTDDYRTLANGRVIDKASIITYQTYITELKDNVDLDAQGNIDVASAKYLEGKITQAIKLGMGDSISGDPVVNIPLPQNLATGSNFIIQLRVTPKGYLKAININIGFQS